MALLASHSPAIAGTTFAPVAATGGGDTLSNPRGTAFLYVKNGGGGSINVTFAAVTTNRPADGAFPLMTLGNNVVAVGAGVEKIIGPIPAAFNDGNGIVAITYSGVTSVTVAAVQPA